ncbi:Ubiquitin-conjugating enzyme family protein [Trichomonas vaginalis G3]|uniref:Ubiquitin-conjugating enzyme family protein n=1 Tax=Trichomonas vaginalis (strain ATCC PRA-98 / G3) TaxID=412133 RepID=A2EJF5_TRIV3|nr:ubiquitin-conjugating enzyme family [Trichomonas vaginalis G3]EAY07212.1 Ubiquitin-conjugating enzyme family protein [Trichomonas vaginalis G3]KAI5533900.1 ubiquitin-conjugating enzyme family [Trichomonas vaginalis G3]|eukprot:XP_001319435.1 Ubiquitin-conjugating enzyme family protein [Trichomonas vaginalis G3]
MQDQASFAIQRLTEERSRWRKDHPAGFIARPIKQRNGNLDLFNWECLIPGPEKSLWEGGFYRLLLSFPTSYPINAPIAKFDPIVPHVNVFPSGKVCLSILTDGWKPSINLRQILVGIQKLLIEPNPESPAHQVNYDNYMMNRPLYDANIKECAKMHTKNTLD